MGQNNQNEGRRGMGLGLRIALEGTVTQDRLRNGVENSAEIKKHKSTVVPICRVL